MNQLTEVYSRFKKHFLKKKYVIPFLISAAVFLVVDKFCYAYNFLFPECSEFEKIIYILSDPISLLHNPLISFNGYDFLIAIMAAFLTYILILYRKPKKQYRQSEEYGSAKWAKNDEIQKFMDKNPWNNIILTATESLTLNDYIDHPTNGRNKNVLIVGGPGTGKTRFFVIPNIMQMNSSYVITDPKGTILPEVGNMLEKVGKYDIKILNLKDLSESMHYNPLEYVRTELDIIKFANMLVEATKSADEKSDFWVKAEKLLYQAVLGLMVFEAPPEEKTMDTMIEIINSSQTSESDEGYENAVDLLFKDLEEKSQNALQ